MKTMKTIQAERELAVLSGRKARFDGKLYSSAPEEYKDEWKRGWRSMALDLLKMKARVVGSYPTKEFDELATVEKAEEAFYLLQDQ